MKAIPATGDPAPLLNRMSQVLSTIEETDSLFAVAELMYESGFLPETAQIYEHMLNITTRFRGKDRVYFMLGMLYESVPLRDEKKAHAFYTTLLDRYPASRYYEEARDRAQYLDSHFLRIR